MQLLFYTASNQEGEGNLNIYIYIYTFVQLKPQEAEQQRGVQSQTAPVSETGEPHVIHHIYFCPYT